MRANGDGAVDAGVAIMARMHHTSKWRLWMIAVAVVGAVKMYKRVSSGECLEGTYATNLHARTVSRRVIRSEIRYSQLGSNISTSSTLRPSRCQDMSSSLYRHVVTGTAELAEQDQEYHH